MKRNFLPEGMHRSREYNVWTHMKRRCLNKSNPAYRLYGGRGVTICDRWVKDFMAFRLDMGACPKGMSIDRIDNNKGYSPDNCRWATPREQGNNVRHNVVVEYGGNKMSLTEFGRFLGFTKQRIWFLYKVRKLTEAQIVALSLTNRKDVA